MAAYNKGKEINNSILEAEKKAAQEATEQGKTALEIEAKKSTREAIEKSKQGEIATRKKKTQEYDLMKVIDTEKIKKTFGVFAEVNKLTAEQRAYLDDLEKQNQKIYDLTTKLSIADLQKSMLLLTQNDLHTFANQVDVELDLLKRYKEDLNLIKIVLQNYPLMLIQLTSSLKRYIKTIKNVISYLEEQVYKF